MEHIVQFAIGIDDKAIQNRIEEHAYEDVLDKLTKKAMDSVSVTPARIRRPSRGRP